jgi:hypothetical protein
MCSSKKPDPPKKVAAAPALPEGGATTLRNGTVRARRRNRIGGTDSLSSLSIPLSENLAQEPS